MNTTWHQFKETPNGDDECGRCAVVVSPDAHLTFTLPCPAGDCPSSSNPDRGCVFAPTRLGVSGCVYCGRGGGRSVAPPPSSLEALFLADLEDAT